MNPLAVGALGLAAIVLLTKGSKAMLPRGLRNNNPGNLRKFDPPIPWKGRAPEAQQVDADFDVFTAPHWGIRAMGRDLTTDYNRDGQQTIKALISEYAPGSENNTTAYINAVSKEMSFPPEAVLDLGRDLPSLVAAIIRHENGQQPYALAYIAESLAIA